MPFGDPPALIEDRLVADVERVLDEVGRRYKASMAEFYPKVNERQPWGYLWAVTLPCQECGRRFPVTGSLALRHPLPAKNDPGQSYRIEVDRQAGAFRAVIHEGPPSGNPTLVVVTKGGKAQRGKAAVCPFCEHVHPKDVHTRLASEGLGEDVLLIAADIDPDVGKSFREPTVEEYAAAAAADAALHAERPFAPGLPAVPDEEIPPGNYDTVRPSMYGARTYGDICNGRQTLGFVRLCRIISELSQQLLVHGTSADYAAALTAYAGSVIARRLRRSTRGVGLLLHLTATTNTVQTGTCQAG